MQEITNPEIIKEFEKKKLSDTGIEGLSLSNEVNDPEIVKKFQEQKKDQTIEGSVKKSLGAIKEFFTGTKRTEYPELPELGSYKGEGALKVAIGTMINPNQKAQAEIIKAQIPGSEIVQDKYENIIAVMPDGKSFYLNKPGASQQDFIQTTGQVLQYIPGYSTAIKLAGKSLLKKSLYAGAAGGATSVAQDVATKPLGATEIDVPRAVISTVVPTVFEGAVNPIAAKTWKKLVGNPKFVTKTKDGKLVLNSKGRKAAKDAGVDPDNVDEKFIKSFSDELSRGIKTDIAASQAGAGKFGFRLSKSQAIGDDEGMAALIEASKGAYGLDAQKAAREFLKQQNIDIETTASNLLNKFNKGEIAREDIESAGQNILNAVQKNFTKSSEKVTTAYNMVDKDAVFNAGDSNIDVLSTSVQKAIKESTDVIDKELTPATIKGIQSINNFIKKVKPQGKKKLPVTTFQEFETLRKKISALFPAAKNATDRKNLTAILNEYDKFYDDAIDNALFSGDEVALNAIKQARSEFNLKQKLFGVNAIKKNGIKIDDRAGKVIQKILNDPDVTPLNTIDYIFGSAQLGQKQGSLSLVRRLKTIFGGELGEDVSELAARSSDFQSLRTASFEKLIRDSSRNGVFNPQKFVNQWSTARQKYNDVLKELYDPDELRLIDDFVREVRKTFKPKDLVNASNTASAMSRTIQNVGRALVGIFGFKFANIQGLLAARTAFDRARDVVGEKAAKKLIQQEIIGIGQRATPPGVTAAETIGVQELTDRYRRPLSVPVAPQGLIRR
jgi:hypothetical protein